MLSGFDRAVGPVHAGERPSVAPYECQIAMTETQAEPCAFALYDAGTGRTYVECITHSYAVMAVDWTAPQFGGGLSLAEHVQGMRDRFVRMKELTQANIDVTVPDVRQARFGDMFESITSNLDAAIAAVVKMGEGNG
jgi:hypothetical protein